MTFTLGLVLIMFADRILPPSIEQEVMAFIGVLLIAVGGLISLSGFIGIAFGRILSHILPANQDKNNPDD